MEVIGTIEIMEMETGIKVNNRSKEVFHRIIRFPMAPLVSVRFVARLTIKHLVAIIGKIWDIDLIGLSLPSLDIVSLLSLALEGLKHMAMGLLHMAMGLLCHLLHRLLCSHPKGIIPTVALIVHLFSNKSCHHLLFRMESPIIQSPSIPMDKQLSMFNTLLSRYILGHLISTLALLPVMACNHSKLLHQGLGTLIQVLLPM